MAEPIQKGEPLLVKGAPTFENFVVVKDTWKESDPLEVEKLQDGNGETFNHTGSDPGIDAQCTWVVKAGQTPAKKMDVVTATYSGPTTKLFLVVDAENDFRGGKPMKQSVKLELRDSEDLA